MKCDPYWPAEPWETAEYGKVKVVNKGIANRGDYQITLLEATHKDVSTPRAKKSVELPLLGVA